MPTNREIIDADSDLEKTLADKIVLKDGYLSAIAAFQSNGNIQEFAFNDGYADVRVDRAKLSELRRAVELLESEISQLKRQDKGNLNPYHNVRN